MAKYKDSSGNVIEVGTGYLNQDLIAGMTKVDDSTPLGSSTIKSSDISDPADVPYNPEEPADIYNPPVAEDGEVTPPRPNEYDDIARGLFEDIQGYDEQLEGKAEFEAQEREKAGVANIEQAANDVSAQIKTLNLKAQDLANKYNNVDIRLQAESEGRGRTEGGVAPLSAQRKREIAIQQADIASQALTAQAEYSAIQGDLANARILVKDAVERKYGGIIAARQAAIDNLDLLVKSGILSREEARIADEQRRKEQKAIEETEQEMIRMEAIETAIVDLMPEIKKLPNATTIISQMKDAGSVSEALMIASDAGVNIDAAPDLTGTSTDLRTFAMLRPDLTVGTPEFEKAFNEYRASNKSTKGSTPSGVDPIADEIMTMTNAEVGAKVTEVFAPAFASKIKKMFSNEMLREFLYNYLTLVEENQQSIDPEMFLKEYQEWIKTEKNKSSSSDDSKKTPAGKDLPDV